MTMLNLLARGGAAPARTMKRVSTVAWVLAWAVAAGGCAQVTVVRNADSPACAAALRQGIGDILVGQGEKPDIADALAGQASQPALLLMNGPRPFFLRSPSGADYGMFYDRREPACLGRLYMRRQGFTTYTNNMTYIDTRALAGCDCGR